MTIELRDREFRRFRDIFYQHSGIALSEEKRMLVFSRLSKRLRHHQMKSFKEYLCFLEGKSGRVELQPFINILTTNETRFYRESKQFDFLVELFRSAQLDVNRRFRIWSAACSTGQEAYTLAMTLLDEGLGKLEIVASDINSNVLVKGKKAVYSTNEAKGIPRHLLKKYWLEGVRDQDGMIMAGPALKDAVDFKQINLVNALPDIGLFNVIFLRNVLIYFNDENTNAILKSIVRKLPCGGYLMMGHSESILNCDSFGLKGVSASVYQKK